MLKEPHEGESCFFPGTQRLHYPRYPCPAEQGTRLMCKPLILFYQLGWIYAFSMEDTNMEDDELQVYLKWTLHSIDLLYTAIQCMITFVVQWDAHLPEVSMNIWRAKVSIPLICNTFIQISCRTSFFVVGMIYSLFITIIPSFIIIICTVFWSAASLSSNIVVL